MCMKEIGTNKNGRCNKLTNVFIMLEKCKYFFLFRIVIIRFSNLDKILKLYIGA